MNAIEQGYSITPAYLTKAECTRLIDALWTQALSRSRAGARHLLGSQVVAALAQSDLLIGLASGWLSGRALPFRATLFDKSLNANRLVPWHQDTALPLSRRFELDGWGPWSEKAGVT
ncbi:MAG TPA: hypothetical protein VKB88_30205 [Bryobacteraceae bacterium]|nr:hypothetical protein [Bryobacteraceae bacterium]